MNKTFRENVTSTKFALTLSKSMIFHLLWLSESQHVCGRSHLTLAGLTDTTVPTRGRLAARGLVYSPDPNFPGNYKLTRAGELVVELIKEAGLDEEFKEVIE